ncbi:hypothetical protein K493DRAFT_299373 [Basidiobolus meristosporus CBS 931.73]|uniref:Chromo domain-containing protein n=1 Tax=Basidiobolus meristosporus CBS 931.73 TaxID=1314790 RepID=A0A1Y1YN72_9FUNG|nr:hypothetical protein K493DRAFT_299373 [Basidiobolus meristosporus CBS 931.73]|eukprot:ORX99459.1 hypothetical protein K493DRAFT_299373 [Basidiobolus meristosporus CBS 931.73]
MEVYNIKSSIFEVFIDIEQHHIYVAKRLKGKQVYQGRVYFLVEWDRDINHCDLEDTWEPLENVLGTDLMKETTSNFEKIDASWLECNQNFTQTPRDVSSSDESSTHLETPPSYFEENQVYLNSQEVSQEYTPSQRREKSFQDMFSPSINTPSNRSLDSHELPKFNTPSYLSSFQEPIMSTPKSKYKSLPVFDTPTRLSYTSLTPVRRSSWKAPSSPSENLISRQERADRMQTHDQTVGTSRTQHSSINFSEHSERYPQNSQPTNHEYVSPSSEEIMDELYTRLLEEAEAEVQKEASMQNTNKSSSEPLQCESPSVDWTNPQSPSNSPPVFTKSKATSLRPSSASTKRLHTMTGSAYELLLATTSEIELLRVDKPKEKKFYQNLIAKSMLISNIELKNELIDFVEFKDTGSVSDRLQESQWPINDWRILPQSELWLFKVSEVQTSIAETQKCVCLVLNVPKRKITSILLPSWLMQQKHRQQAIPATLCDDGSDTGSHLCQLQCCQGNPLSIENLSRYIESQVNFSNKNLSSPSIQEIIDSTEKVSETTSFLYNQSPKSGSVAQDDLSIIMETQQLSKASTPSGEIKFRARSPIRYLNSSQSHFNYLSLISVFHRSLTPELIDVAEESEISLSFEGSLYFSIEQYASSRQGSSRENATTPLRCKGSPSEYCSRGSQPQDSPSFLADAGASPIHHCQAELDDLQEPLISQYQFRSPADLSTCRTRKSPTSSIRSDRLLSSGRSQRQSINQQHSQNISLSLDLVSQDSASQSPIVSLDSTDFQVLQRADLYRAYTKLKRENRRMKSRNIDPMISRQ